MKTILAKILLTATLPLSASLALATDYDFQSQTAGAATTGSGITVFRTSPALVNIAASGTTPVDAFGGTGNQSLYLSSTASGGAQAQLSLSSTAITSGTLSFDLYVVGTGTTPGLIEIDLGNPSSGSSSSQRSASIAALQVWTNDTTTTDSSHTAAGHFLGFMGGISGGSNLYAFNQTVLIGAKNTMSISWDATANTYSILLNGVTVTQGTSSIVSTFVQTTEQSGVTGVRFTTSNASSTSYFIDNITVSSIPEPSTTAGLVGAAVGMVALCRRRSVTKRRHNVAQQG
ncbi:MAG: PEP-CTERM sorting domain-containing protein [Opitutaceae bacterium]|jgi:hypothetical protein